MVPGAQRILAVYLSLWQLVAASCGGSGDSSGSGDSGDSPLDAAKDAGREACARYIDCALEVAPESIAVQLASYGPDGTCWESDDTRAVEICTSACKKLRDGLGELFPDVGVCGQCDVDAHCLDYQDGPRCDVKLHACVDCLEDGDCDGVCDVETHTCVDCVADEDCSAGVCDETSRLCVGCLVATDCPGNFCNYETHVCIECYTDIHCTGGKKCTMNKCV